jgi:hypothetical protein
MKVREMISFTTNIFLQIGPWKMFIRAGRGKSKDKILFNSYSAYYHKWPGKFIPLIVLFICFLQSCKEEYNPPAIQVKTNYLVVDGIINSGPDSTIITLSRTKNITDTTFTTIPELNAVVSVEEEGGTSYILSSLGNGQYGIGPLTLNNAKRYRLKVMAGGNIYSSDYVPVKQTPAIDSISWEQPGDLTFFVNTHDPNNNTWYYRWEYDETWEYQTPYESFYIFENGHIRDRDSSELVHICYRHANSNDIILGTSSQLSQDIVTHVPLATIPQNSRKLAFRYSINVKQYALTEDAFKYWQLLKKNTQQLGTLFDVQPSQLTGNIHSEGDPSEPVIGYVSVSSVQSKRIFVTAYSLHDWHATSELACTARIPPGDSVLIYLSLDPSIGIAYACGAGCFALSKRECYDCTLLGGTNIKPSYWP